MYNISLAPPCPAGNPENEDGIDFDAVDGTTMLGKA